MGGHYDIIKEIALVTARDLGSLLWGTNKRLISQRGVSWKPFMLTSMSKKKRFWQCITVIHVFIWQWQTVLLIGKPFNRKDLIFDLQLLMKSTLCRTDNKNASLFFMLLKIKIKMMHTLFDSMLSFRFLLSLKRNWNILATGNETMSRVEMFQPCI